MTSAVIHSPKLSEFDYDLPEHLIAQEPAAERDGSRLLVLDRTKGTIVHRMFSDVGEYLRSGDVLVVNDTKVFPCRLPAVKETGGRSELFLIEEQGLNLWRALVKGGIGVGGRVRVGSSAVEAEIVADEPDGSRIVRFSGIPDIRQLIADEGKTPLPPYIRREAGDHDRERYQTVYAAREGAVAAPTAGLHFTRAMLDRLASAGIEILSVTLHVGPGTFQPVRHEDVREHPMHPERYEISGAAAERINQARAERRRIIAVGTTTVRTLETAVRSGGAIAEGAGSSRLFIYPGYEFKAVDGMITNFHLPKSTLLMLVSAFAGRERVLAAYREAVREGYRFFSFGDAMMIL